MARLSEEAARAGAKDEQRRQSILEVDEHKSLSHQIMGITDGGEFEAIVANNSQEVLELIQKLANAYIDGGCDLIVAKHEIERLEDELSEAQATAQQASELERETQPRIDELNNEVDDLKEKLSKAATELARALRASPAGSTLSIGGSKSDRLPDPEQFSGEGKIEEQHHKFMVWKRQMLQKMKVNGDRYADEQARSAYAQSRVNGQASQFLEAWLQENEDCSANEILDRLEEIYADPNAKLVARKDYQAARQGKENVTTFLNRFRSLAVMAGISEQDQLLDVRERLSPYLQKNMGMYNADSMSRFILDVTSLDRRLTAAGVHQDNAPANGPGKRVRFARTSSEEAVVPTIEKTTYTQREYAPRPRNDSVTCYDCGRQGHIRGNDCNASQEEKDRYRKENPHPWYQGKAQPYSKA